MKVINTQLYSYIPIGNEILDNLMDNKYFLMFSINNNIFEYELYNFIYKVHNTDTMDQNLRYKKIYHTLNSESIDSILTSEKGYGHKISIGDLYNSGETTISFVKDIYEVNLSFCDIVYTKGFVKKHTFYIVLAELLDTQNNFPEEKYYFYIPEKHKDGYFSLNSKTLVSK